ncbi:MAG TPA: NUDIX hydrolase [Candidatus Saccharimonadales bacterium]|nr:NUDIX hydrolase [Candidatus Saccharimonadales bacterium]
MTDNNPWRTISSETIFENPWIKLVKDEVITPIGKPGSYTILEAKPFVIVVAIQDDQVVMIDQHRYPINRTTLEFPAGGIDGTENPLEAAKRELKEETGYEASDWEDVGQFYEIVSISRQPGHLFIARNLRNTQEHEMAEDGISGCRLVKIQDLENMIANGSIVDALTPAVLFKAQLHIRNNK